MSADINNLLNRLQKVRKSGSGFRACCPAHNGKDANLSVTQADDGRILINCLSHGCAVYDILQSVGLDWPDVFPERLEGHAIKGRKALMTAADGLRLLRYESQIVMASAIAMRDKTITVGDLERLKDSMRRINDIYQACGL